MKHYRQIILNVQVDDDLPEEELVELSESIKNYVAENTDKNKVQNVDVRVN